MAVKFGNFLFGTTDAALGVGATTISGAIIASVPAISSPDIMWLTIDPEGIGGTPDLVQITAHTAAATTATISATARSHVSGIPIAMGVTAGALDNFETHRNAVTGNPHAVVQADLGMGQHAKVTRGADQTITTATHTFMVWGSEELDTSAFHDTVTNNERITIPSGLDGLYLLMAQIEWATNATGIRQIRILKNQTNPATAGGLANSNQDPTSGATNTRHVAVGMARLVAGDFVSVSVFQSSGGNLAAVADTGSDKASWFAAYRLGP